MCIQPPADQSEVLPLWEVSNPHDPYTVRGKAAVAGVLILLVGEGRYGLKNVQTGKTLVPVFLLCKEEDFDRWIEQFKADHGISEPLGEFVRSHLVELVAVGESLLIGSPSQRESLEFMLGAIPDEREREKALLLHHDARRTSTVDLRKVVQQWVQHWRTLLAKQAGGG
ncbi:MAG: hypothetical protein WC789_06785 [Lentisphaeria bacterium]